MFDPVGLADIAERLVVSDRVVRRWRTSGVLPVVEATVSGSPCWQWKTIERWVAERESGRWGREVRAAERVREKEEIERRTAIAREEAAERHRRGADRQSAAYEASAPERAATAAMWRERQKRRAHLEQKVAENRRRVSQRATGMAQAPEGAGACG